MWKGSLTYLTHRIFLFLVILVSLNFRIVPAVKRSDVLPQIHSFDRLWAEFYQRVSTLPEVDYFARQATTPPRLVMQVSTRPFVWALSWLNQWSILHPVWVLMFLSNVFVILLIGELLSIWNRMATQDINDDALNLFILWPATIFMTLGSEIPFYTYLLLLSVRMAWDNNWLVSSLAFALAFLTDAAALFVFPMIAFFFYYFERHRPTPKLVKTVLLWVLPLIPALYLKGNFLPQFMATFHRSAFSDLINQIPGGGILDYVYLHWISTLALLILLTGTITAVLRHDSWIHKVIPVSFFLLFLFSIPYRSMAGFIAVGIVAVEAAVALLSDPLIKGFRFIFFCWGIWQTYQLFH